MAAPSSAVTTTASGASRTPVRTVNVLLYSDDVATRDAVRVGVGRRPAKDVEIGSWRECATAPAVIEAVESGGYDLIVLDGEASPVGGLGLCRQLKNEIFDCPPVVVLTGARRTAGSRHGRWPSLGPAAAGPAGAGLDPRRRRPHARPGRLTRMAQDTAPTWPTVLKTLLAGESLPADAAQWAMDQILTGTATPVQLAAFLVALRAKGGDRRRDAWPRRRHARTTRSRSRFPAPPSTSSAPAATSGHTVNISTMSSIVAVGAGAHVVKHGNRAASSSSGSADVLEALGVRLDLEPEQVRQVALDAGITFCFAQTFHPSLRHAGSARREMGIPTALNLLGPLTNPAQPRYSAIASPTPGWPVHGAGLRRPPPRRRGLPRRRRAGRAHPLHDVEGLVGA